MVRAAARALAARRVPPNAISIIGMLAACAAGLLLASTGVRRSWDVAGGGLGGGAGEAPVVVPLLAAACLVQLRLLANLLDGMVAVEGGLGSPLGALYNELPDRVSDSAVLVGAGYAIGSDPTLGWSAALLAMLVTCVRLLGASLALRPSFVGPMAKQQRMMVVTLACLAAALVPPSRDFIDAATARTLGLAPHAGAIGIALVLVAVGCCVTIARRIRKIARSLNDRPHA